MTISYLSEHPDFASVLAPEIAAHWQPYLPDETVEKRLAKLRAHMNTTTLPIAWVAHNGGEVSARRPFGSMTWKAAKTLRRGLAASLSGSNFGAVESRRRCAASPKMRPGCLGSIGCSYSPWITNLSTPTWGGRPTNRQQGGATKVR